MKKDPYRYFEYFSGYVPAGLVFQMAADDIARITLTHSEPTLLNHLCLIGLVSYFEAFAKDHLASTISIAPEIIDALKRAGYSTDLAAEDVYEYKDRLQYLIGFLISQRLDTGSAKKLNAIFTSALKITPFSKDEIKAHEKLLRDRNLIVHHGGAYTTTYIRQAFNEIPPERRRAHGDSLVIQSDRILSEVEFLKNIARKLILATSNRLTTILDKSRATIPIEVRDAVSAIAWWDDNIDENLVGPSNENSSVDDPPF